MYMSPEIIDGHYNTKCDIWSIGVMLYYTISGIYVINYYFYYNLIFKFFIILIMNIKFLIVIMIKC
jgi:serine/threonine protein kinase